MRASATAAARRSQRRPPGGAAQGRDRPLLRRRRVDGARRAARPGGAPQRPVLVLRVARAVDRAPRRHRREVHRRRGHGGLRRAGRARGRRAARRARGPGARATAFPSSASTCADRRQHRRGRAPAPRTRSSPATRSTSPRGSSRPRSRARCCSAPGPTRSSATPSTSSARAAVELKGKAEPVAAYRLLAVTGEVRRLRARHRTRRWSAAHDELTAARRRLRERARRSAPARSSRSSAAAGVGKSRLAAEFLAGLDATRRHAGAASPTARGSPTGPSSRSVKQLPARELARRRAAERSRRCSARRRATRRTEIAWAVRKLLEAAARIGRSSVVFDDIHWGEPTFLDLVEHVADWSRDAPILLLCLARPELLDRRPSWGGGKLNATDRAARAALDRGDRRADRRAARRRGASMPALRERIRAAAEGNPLFVEQMLAMVEESPASEVAVPRRSRRCSPRASTSSTLRARRRSSAARSRGRLFHRGAVAALAPEEPDVADRELARARAQGARPSEHGAAARRRRVPLPPPADPRRRLRRAPEGGARRAARALRGLARASEVPDLVELDEILGYHLEQAARYRAELGAASAELATKAAGAARRRGIARRRARGLERGRQPAHARRGALRAGRSSAARASDSDRPVAVHARQAEGRLRRP